MAKTTAKRTASKGEVEVFVDLGGDVHKGAGADVFQALDALELDYTKVKSKGTITLKAGGKQASKFFYLQQLRRIVSSKLRKAQVGKDLMFLLK